MYKRRQIGLITGILLLYGCSQGEEEFAGRVIRILDGDTIEVLHNRSPERIRLAEIDAPEKSQPFGTRARQFAAELAFNQTVTVRPHDRDRYGRTVAEIILPDGRSLNRELVRNGFAWHYRRYSSDQTLEALEQEARDNRRGLWHDLHPVPPWEFRQEHRGTVDLPYGRH